MFWGTKSNLFCSNGSANRKIYQIHTIIETQRLKVKHCKGCNVNEVHRQEIFSNIIEAYRQKIYYLKLQINVLSGLLIFQFIASLLPYLNPGLLLLKKVKYLCAYSYITLQKVWKRLESNWRREYRQEFLSKEQQ